MANYYATARSNYFAVTDLEAFDAFCRKWSLQRIDDTFDGKPIVGFYVDHPDQPGFPTQPTYRWLEEQGLDDEDYEGNDLPGDLMPLLADGWVAVGEEAGSEKMRYVGCYAWCVNNKGEREDFDLDQIVMDAAKKLGTHVTTCAY